MQNVVVFGIYILLSIYGLYKIKSSIIGFNTEFVVGFSSYVLGFLIWLYILKTNPLSVAFPVAAGSLIVATQIIGFLFLGERVNAVKELGVIFVLVGIFMVYSNES